MYFFRVLLVLALAIPNTIMAQEIDLGGRLPGGIAVLSSIPNPPDAVASISIADSDLDGDVDFFVSGGATDTVLIVTNDGGGTFFETQQIPVGSGPGTVVADDFDGDGDPDIATMNINSEQLSILSLIHI